MFALFHSVPWVHLPPAILAVVFAFLYLRTKWIYLKVLWGLLWLLLVPNTAYIFIDVKRITLHWSSVSTEIRTALVIQYTILEIIGLVTYLLAMLPLEMILRTRYFSKKQQIITIILFNFLIGFGIVLGRTGYTNSYVVFTQPMKVLFAVIHIATSFNMLVLAVVFGILCDCIYFIFRNILLHRTRSVRCESAMLHFKYEHDCTQE